MQALAASCDELRAMTGKPPLPSGDHHWSSTWDLNFNTKKCVALRFSRRKTSAPTQGYVLNQKPIKFAATQNDLGILVSNDLKWSSHVINIVAKANRMLGFL